MMATADRKGRTSFLPPFLTLLLFASISWQQGEQKRLLLLLQYQQEE
jgi:hypothetical protein